MPRPLPKTKAARGRLILRDSLGYVRRMGPGECNELLLSLAKTEGLTREEADEALDEVHNVAWEYVPDRLKG